ncbi:MAG: 50S ribosomal protein L1 [Patescibacteria group bacterium]
MKKVDHPKSKRLKEVEKLIDFKKIYPLAEAIDLVKKTSTVKFDAGIEAHINLGINTKKSDQQVRSTVILPHGNGKVVKVAVVATSGDQQKAAKEAGADLIGEKDLIEDIQKGKLDFDILVATPDAMKMLGLVAKILGPKGLMPNPKDGTVAQNVGEAVANLKKGKVSFKNDDSGNLHVLIGKISFDNDKLTENFNALVESIRKAKPAGAKGSYIKSVSLCSSMGPGVKVAYSV